QQKSYAKWDLNAITNQIHHPAHVPSPLDKPAVKVPLLLTKKERKKLRKQRRMAMLQEKTDKIRLGLLPPDPPKIKLSNMMRVMRDQAIQDPSRYEAQVRKGIQKRREIHEQQNRERQLSAEQKRQKILNKIKTDEAVGLFAAAFRVQDLALGQHQYKVT